MGFNNEASAALNLDEATQEHLAELIGAQVPVPPTANDIGNAVGGAVPVPPSANAIGTAVGGAVPVPPSAASIATLTGAAVPQPASIASAALNAGQKLVDQPAILSLTYTPPPGPPSNAAGRLDTGVLDARDFLSFTLVLQSYGAARGSAVQTCRLNWFADAAGTILMFSESFTANLDVTAAITQTSATDRHHGPWFSAQIIGTVSNPAATLVMSNRPVDRLRLYERTAAIPFAGGDNNVIAYDDNTINIGGQIPTGGSRQTIACLAPGPAALDVFSTQPGTVFLEAAVPGGFVEVFAATVNAGRNYYPNLVLPRNPVTVALANGGSGSAAYSIALVADQD